MDTQIVPDSTAHAHRSALGIFRRLLRAPTTRSSHGLTVRELRRLARIALCVEKADGILTLEREIRRLAAGPS